MREQCSNCRFWTPWREVMLADDAPQMIGHCVVLVPIAGHDARPVVQGLTGNDFHCNGYKEMEPAAVRCVACQDTGHVCENHPDRPWGNPEKRSAVCDCGGAGMPCLRCCSPVPEDGTHSIAGAFTPDWRRK